MLDFEIKKMLEVTEEDDQVFFKIDCIGDRYSMNRRGLIFDNKLKRDLYPHYKGGYLKVRLNIEQGFVDFDLRKLVLMCFSPMHTTLDVYINKLKVISFDGKLCNLNLDNLLWKIPQGGVECVDYPGFYSIAGNPDLVVSKDYRFVRHSTGESVEVNKSDFTGYCSISSQSEFNGVQLPFHTTTVHRLVAFAFMSLEGIKQRFYVDLLDGNGLNYDISNLTWVEYKKRDVLIPDPNCIVAVDIYSKKKRYFHSLQAAAKSLNFHAWDISKAIELYKDKGKIGCPPWLFLREGDDIPTSFIKIQKRIDPIGVRWFLVEKDGIKKYCSGVVNLFRHVSGTKDVIEAVKVPYNAFKANGFDIKEVYRQDVPPEAYKKEEENRGGKVQKAIRVTTLSSGAVATYPSTDHFAALVGAKRKTIQRGMLYNNGVWHDFKIEYVDSL